MLFRTIDEALHASSGESGTHAVPQGARDYAQTYREIRADFLEAVGQFGLGVAPEEQAGLSPFSAEVDQMAQAGLHVENARSSLWLNWISPACLACRKAVGTQTFLTSTQCPKKCFFCFNPNQENYAYYQTHVRNIAADLEAEHAHGVRLQHLAVTGGEPLLHKRELFAFLERARKLYPNAYTRLYTCGEGMDAQTARELREAGLNEVRFSIKTQESATLRQRTLDALEGCVGVFDATMVEMPVMPDELSLMQDLLVELDKRGATGINLLELCFPFNNAAAFARRGYSIKHEPYRVPYDYWYAGGLPIEGSEDACIRLLSFAIERELRMGVHYCSLENKLTGQIYQQNAPFKQAFPPREYAQRGHFLACARIFAADAAAARRILAGCGQADFAGGSKAPGQVGIVNNSTAGGKQAIIASNSTAPGRAGIAGNTATSGQTNIASDLPDATQADELELAPSDVALLAGELPHALVAIGLGVVEERPDGRVLRELDARYTTPSLFDLADLQVDTM